MTKHLRLFFRLFLFSLFLPCIAAPASGADRTLALFPFAIYAEHPGDYVRQGLRNMFVSRLSGGGLDVITDQSFGSLLSAEERTGKITRKRVEEVARERKADYAVFGSVTTIGGGSSLDLSFLDLTKTPPKLTHVSEAMTGDQFIPKLAEVANRFRAIIEGRYAGTRRIAGGPGPSAPEAPSGGIFSKLGQPEGTGEQEGFFQPTRQYAGFEPTGRIPVPLAVVSFDAGDLTGDGNRELLVLGRHELRVYTKRDQGYALKDTRKSSRGEDYLKVSVGDVDGNGKAEIYLVSFYGERARTTVLEWNGRFRELFQKTGHLVAVQDPGGGAPRLLYEGTQINKLFAGGISLMGYDASGKLKEIRRLPEIKGVRFYSLTPYDLNKDGSPEFIGLGENNCLHVWDGNGEVLWKEDESIGGSNDAIQVGDVPYYESKPWAYINSRLVVTDIDGDGKKEVVAVKNIPLIKHLENMLVYVKAQLIAYRISGATLTRGWTTREIPYCITDIQAAKGTLFVAVQKGRFSKIGPGTGRIMWFNLQ